MIAITGAQVRAARALVRLTAQEVADRSGLGVATIRRAEAVEGPVSMTRANLEALRRTLEAAGVVFIEENGGGPGVRLARRQG